MASQRTKDANGPKRPATICLGGENQRFVVRDQFLSKRPPLHYCGILTWNGGALNASIAQADVVGCRAGTAGGSGSAGGRRTARRRPRGGYDEPCPAALPQWRAS